MLPLLVMTLSMGSHAQTPPAVGGGRVFTYLSSQSNLGEFPVKNPREYLTTFGKCYNPEGFKWMVGASIPDCKYESVQREGVMRQISGCKVTSIRTQVVLNIGLQDVATLTGCTDKYERNPYGMDVVVEVVIIGNQEPVIKKVMMRWPDGSSTLRLVGIRFSAG